MGQHRDFLVGQCRVMTVLGGASVLYLFEGVKLDRPWCALYEIDQAVYRSRRRGLWRNGWREASPGRTCSEDG